MSTEIPVLYNKLREKFDSALQNSGPGDYVARPRSLNRLAAERRSFVKKARETNKKAIEQLEKDSRELSDLYGVTTLEAADLVLQAWDKESRLAERGVIFGEVPFNFSLDRIKISKEEELKIIQATENAMVALQVLASDQSEPSFLPLTPVEREFENLKLIPNAARVDILLTESGPKIIEINSQWVDAIAALSGFLFVYEGGPKSGIVRREFSRVFPPDSRLAIVNIPQTSGSRSQGATLELQELSKRLFPGTVIASEVVDPEKTRLDYLAGFNAFYVNCDPRSLGIKTPDWLELIIERVSNDTRVMFPSWRPLLDKKFILSILSQPDEEMSKSLQLAGVDVNLLKKTITPTKQLADLGPTETPFVVKGDGYSLNSVAIKGQENFDNFVRYALEQPAAYVVQPFINARQTNMWVYDTGTKKVRLLENAYTKINVWYINGKVVGMLATVNETPLISDRGYSSPPLVVEGEKTR